MSDTPSPPHDDEVEISLLGTMLLYPDDVRPVLTTLSPDDWYNEGYRPVARALMEGIENARPHDAATLAHFMRSSHSVLPGDFVAKMMDAAPSGAAVSRMAGILKDLSLKRQGLTALAGFDSALRNGRPYADFVAELVGEVLVIGAKNLVHVRIAAGTPRRRGARVLVV